MSGEGDNMYAAPRKHVAEKMRVHDYLYDSAFIVSNARDYARMAFKAAMSSAQVIIQPVYKSMFSENVRKRPRIQVVYYPNCRLPQHMDLSYSAYVSRARQTRAQPAPDLSGKDRFRFNTAPKQVLQLSCISPDFQLPPPTPAPAGPTKPRSRGTQSVYRESSAQTTPWQPDGKVAEGCETTPEVLHLDKLEWGPGSPYRLRDLPADFHTTEIINKMRHARKWMDLVERGCFPRWMKKRDAVISDVETKDWIFREAEIDELQDIRLELLHRMQQQQRQSQTSRTSSKLAKLWANKKQEMEKKIDNIRKSRDRELRKLAALHAGGGRAGRAARARAARGGGAAARAAPDPTADLHAPLARHGYQARRRHARLYYDPELLSYEDHQALAEPPEWLERCGQDLKRTCSGHHPPRDPTKLCERETKWSEQFLENLHNDLKKARLGAASASSGPLHVMRARRVPQAGRPATPQVDAVDDADERNHQAALLLQRILRGRAVQILMYEGRTRASELTEELKTTHGLQKEDRVRIAKEESKAREYNAVRTEAEQKEDAISALVDELCGGAVASALDFLEKELRRLREERRQHAFVLIALREKTMREAAEAGRRQKEEHRRREHDEMFKQILGVTQDTVDTYLQEIVTEGVDLAAEADAVRLAQAQADRIDLSLREHSSVSTAEQNELVAELVQQFLLPHVHKTAARHHITEMQKAKLQAARDTIFGLVDGAEKKEELCDRCGSVLDDTCRCTTCAITQEPQETQNRDDWRWKFSRTHGQHLMCPPPVWLRYGNSGRACGPSDARPDPPEKTMEERYPPPHDIRCMLNAIVQDAVQESRSKRSERDSLTQELARSIRESSEAAMEGHDLVGYLVDCATGAVKPPLKTTHRRHLMTRVVGDALGRSEPFVTCPCPKELPSEIRRRAEEQAAREDPTCRCVEEPTRKSKVQFGLASMTAEQKKMLLPSEVRELEELRRCKCDFSPMSPQPEYEALVTRALSSSETTEFDTSTSTAAPDEEEP